MELNFTKMHGLGNDFVVLDDMENAINLVPEQIRAIADRHFGIGCDQILLIQPPAAEGADIHYRIFNADGDEVEQCGNGIRCVAAYLAGKGRVHGRTVTAESMKGALTVYLEEDGLIRVNMGAPRFEPDEIPLRAERRLLQYPLQLPGGSVSLSILSMGNAHAVLEVPNVETTPVTTLGPEIQAQPMFPAGVNVGFMQVVDRGHIRLRVYERGSGETLACGSGACAAVVAGIMNKRLENEVLVGLPGGELRISWAGADQPVWMTGPATTVYEGRITI